MQKVKMFKSKKYLKAVAQLPCVITGQQAQVHHVIGVGYSGMGMKAPDDQTFPLCPELHDELHRHGWRQWEGRYGAQLFFAHQTRITLGDELHAEKTKTRKVN